ncbi:MAG: hypothetical protein EWM73_00813 [Nitrospira sp.]|nr:MAG: hypothetical protein EWM73_00813 [Nitrospira sp.]
MLFLVCPCRRLPVHCVEIADGINKVLRYIFIEMKVPIEERKGFVTGMQQL